MMRLFHNLGHGVAQSVKFWIKVSALEVRFVQGQL